jgi:hypothetical protein
LSELFALRFISGTFRPLRFISGTFRSLQVSTNIAETSITIDEITHVVDTGRVKEMQYNPEKRMAHLCETWCSQVSDNDLFGPLSI